MAIDKVRVDEPFYFATGGTTNDEGKIEIVSNDVEISNTFNGGLMNFIAKTTGGIPKKLIELQPDIGDGAVYFIENNVRILSSLGNTFLSNFSGVFTIRNLASSQIINISARNASAVDKTLMSADPDIETVTMLAIAGTHRTLAVNSDAVDVKGKTYIMVDTIGGNVTIGGLANGAQGQTIELIKANIANDMVIENNEGTGTQKMLLSTNADQIYSNYGGPKLRLHGSFWYEVGAQS